MWKKPLLLLLPPIVVVVAAAAGLQELEVAACVQSVRVVAVVAAVDYENTVQRFLDPSLSCHILSPHPPDWVLVQTP